MSPNTHQSDRTREILKKVHQIEIRTNRLVNDSLAGQYHSAFKGQGMNFDEVREYQSGDEVKNIDWNVTARTGKPFVKQYIEERERTIVLMIDISASGLFGSGTQTKRELAAEIGSLLAFSAIRNHDKVGLILFSDRVEHYLPPAKGNNHVLRVIRDILFFEPKHKGTRPVSALDHANQVLHRKAVLVMISDFCLPEPHREELSRLIKKMDTTNRKHDLIAIPIHDPVEHELPDCGWITLEDIESGEQVMIDTSRPKTRQAFRDLNRNRRDSIRQELRKKGIESLELVTAGNYLPQLHQFFKTRSRRRL
jgi:uncharacterized protein (DUF58 family)